MEATITEMSLKDFEKLKDVTISERTNLFYDFYLHNRSKKHSNYRIASKIGSGSEIPVIDPYSNEEKKCISFVSNDYLGFTKHPKIIEAGKEALDLYGSGAGSSPLIGGQSVLHDQLEKEIAAFFNKEDAITYTSGYAANSGTLMALLNSNDLVILDMGVHTSVLEGTMLANKKYFLHNDVTSLERILETNKGKYNNMVIIIDGVYSQDGDIAPLDKISELAKAYNAFLIVDEAHGVGVLGEEGKGVFEIYNIFDKVDLITGTFSKSFASVGGFVAGNKEVIAFLKFFAASNIFSAAATPQSVNTVIKAMELLKTEPQWIKQLQSNVAYFRNGLDTLGIDYGKSNSAIFPIMIRDEEKTKRIGRRLFELGIYANPILYPAVSRKQTRIRMSLLAIHTQEMLDKTLNILDYTLKEENII
ncbi:aminotransferase class I/II-fold pyridoxal phosphate-dependent enzyme [Aureivirga marina]|uniref:aminotransferase class I/II-fold pyridoxal phosphate-dependent enzyme n=1 Tax=Aureivirga marina TaxID=1182451 RepID=UPI0018CB5007|nr:aminotransferase class I/II-fold pyridoxal phosphate-dependent enzyme [Aureivirga marina]